MSYKVLIPQAVAKEGVEILKNSGFEVKYGSGATEEDLIKDVVDFII